MKPQTWRWQTAAAAVTFNLVLIFIAVSPGPVFAVPTSIEKKVTDTLETGGRLQRAEKAWHAEKTDLETKAEALSAEKERLAGRLAKLERAVGAERGLIRESRRRMDEIQRIQDGLEISLEEIVGRVEFQMGEGLPFLPEERRERIASVRKTLADPYSPLFEKFRRVFETLLIRAEYGTTTEVSREEIAVAGRTISADILRLGRLAIFFQTIDGRECGMYDPASGEYAMLPDTYGRSLSRAIGISRREAAIDVVTLPIGRIVVQ